MEQNKIFEGTAQDKVRKSAFDLTHTRALSGVMGDLIPTCVIEAIPGDEFNIEQENFVRLAPMLAPVMHMINITTHFFFVPNRIIWTEWEDFITGGQDGTSEPLIPTIPADDAVNTAADPLRRLGDYLGLPSVTNDDSTFDIQTLPFRAYQKIYNDYYRDQTLDTEVDLSIAFEILKIRKSSWQKDYFTSALPFLQRGPEIGVPIELEYKPVTRLVDNTTGTDWSVGDTFSDSTNPFTTIDNSGETGIRKPDGSGGFKWARFENIENTMLDFTINELRTSSALQRFLEKQATGGYRYTETLRSHFNTTAGDDRLDRPEYIGGGKNPVVITEVLSNTETLDSSDNVVNPVGELFGHGVSTGSTIAANYKVEEHGYIIGITRVLPETMYFQGIPKHFLYNDKYDYAWPVLANLGEQPILNAEVFYDPTDLTYNQSTFGYQQRYAQYKFCPSTVHGDFRDSLKFWHMARDFASQPALNSTFVQADPTTRIFNVEDEDHLWIQILNKVKALRPLPYFANPQLR